MVGYDPGAWFPCESDVQGTRAAAHRPHKPKGTLPHTDEKFSPELCDSMLCDRQAPGNTAWNWGLPPRKNFELEFEPKIT